MFISRWISFVVATCLGVAAHAQGTSYVGTYRVDLGATASYDVSYSRVDDTTERRTGTTTVGSGARDMGSLEIKPDGTYALRYLEYELIYKKPVITGRWQAVAPDDPFADLNAIMLFDAKPDMKYPPEKRMWYVFRKEDGAYEARYPPYDGFAKIKLARSGAAPKETPKITSTPPSAPPAVRHQPGTLTQVQVSAMPLEAVKAAFLERQRLARLPYEALRRRYPKDFAPIEDAAARPKEADLGPYLAMSDDDLTRMLNELGKELELLTARGEALAAQQR